MKELNFEQELVEGVCPECDSENVKFLFVSPAGFARWRCNDCNEPFEASDEG